MTSAIEPDDMDTGGGQDWCSALIESRRVTRVDVDRLRLRFSFGLPARADAEALFAIDRALLDKCPEWVELFVELLVDYTVWGERPTGTLNPKQAEWILAEVDRQPTPAGLATLVGIVEEAHSTPQWFPLAARGRVSHDWRRVVSLHDRRVAA